MSGEVVAGRYEIVRLLGQGGMGAVYEASELDTDRHVALKILADATDDELLVERFKREVGIAASIETRHIARVLDAGREDITGRSYMAMELLAGEDLDALVERSAPLCAPGVIRIAGQACIGLHKAHEAGIVHRDIKPANLFLARGEGGERIVKILDFGIAKRRPIGTMSDEAKNLTTTGALMGSPIYMSPEQARGVKRIDGRSDLWSLGIVLYKALSGRAPHEHIDTLGELIISICGETPRSLHEAAPWVDPRLVAVVTRALCIEPDDRYPSAQAMFDDLRELLPHDWSLGDQHLEGATEEERSRLAPPPPAPLEEVLVGSTAQLSPSEPGSSPVSSGAEAISSLNSPMALDATMPSFPDPSLAPTERAPGVGRNRRSLYAAAVLGALVLGAVVVWLQRGDGGAAGVPASTRSIPPSASTERVPETSVPSLSAPTASSAPAQASEVILRIDADPDDAIVYLGSDELGPASDELSVPRGEESVTLTFKRDGYEDKEVHVTPVADVVLSVSLKRKRSTPAVGHPDLESPL